MFSMDYQIASAFVLGFALGLVDVNVAAQSDGPIPVGPQEPQVVTPQAIEQAKTELSRANLDYERKRKLAARGSVSQSALKESQVGREIAELTLRALKDPASASKARLEIAKKRLDVAQGNFDKSKRLFARGSISTLRYRRSRYRLINAQINYNAASGKYSTQSANLLIAKSRLALAEVELELGEQLYRRRAIPKSTYQSLLDRVREAKGTRAELEQLRNKQQQAIEERLGT